MVFVTAHDPTTFLHGPPMCCRSQATEVLEQKRKASRKWEPYM